MPMALPDDNHLAEMERMAESLFLNLDQGAARPDQAGVIAVRAARLQAVSIRRLTVAINQASASADRSANQMWWLTAVILGFTVIAAIGTAMQAFGVGRSTGWW